MSHKEKNRLELADRLSDAIPGIGLSVDGPRKSDGAYVMDATLGECWAVVEYSPRLGYTVHKMDAEGFVESTQGRSPDHDEAFGWVRGILQK